MENHLDNLNKSIKVCFYAEGVMSYFNIRMVLSSIGFTIPVVAIALYNKSQISGAEAGLFMSYAL